MQSSRVRQALCGLGLGVLLGFSVPRGMAGTCRNPQNLNANIFEVQFWFLSKQLEWILECLANLAELQG